MTGLIATMLVFESLLFMALAVPLILRKVPMNPVYGARFSLSFKSTENWYDINAAAGKYLIFWSLPILGIGLYGLMQRNTAMEAYALTAVVLTLGCVGIAVIQSYMAAQKIDKLNRVSQR